MLVIDASLAKRLATELKFRGRVARSVASLTDQGLLDPELFRSLIAALDGNDWVLVTGDDLMPEVHAEDVAETGMTIATVRPWEPAATERKQEAYKREVVHRWAHRMALQEPGELRRYSETAHRSWTSLRRR